MAEHTETDLDFALHLDYSEILSNPILDIGARFWESDRYEAFKVCYRSMRVLDDLVDNRKAELRVLSDIEKITLARMIGDWVRGLKRHIGVDSFQKQLLEQMTRFAIPIWPWEWLAEAMIWDIYYDRFPTLRSFLEYSEGAAVAPASIFTHLCGVRPTDNGYLAPSYDIRDAARMLARFCYLVHIVRDFEKDQRCNLNYFADSILAEEGVKPAELKAAAESRQMTPTVRAVMNRYLGYAEHYRLRSRHNLDRLAPYLERRYWLSLEIIYTLYLQIYERLSSHDHHFAETEVMPAPAEVQGRIDDTIRRFQDAAY